MKETNLISTKDKFTLHAIWLLSFFFFLFAVGLTFLDPNKAIEDWFSELELHFSELIVNLVFGTIVTVIGIMILFFAVVGTNIWGAQYLRPNLIKIRFLISSIILALACFVGIDSGFNRNQWIYFDLLFVLQLLAYGITYEKLKVPASIMFGLLLLFVFFEANSQTWLLYDFLVVLFLLIVGFYILLSKVDIKAKS